MIPLEQIDRIAQTGVMIVVDEAYIEFYQALTSSSTSAIELLPKHPNLMVTRTLSKWAGLAGLRIGYALAHPLLIDAMFAIKQPYSINVAAEGAAVEALRVKESLCRQDGTVVALARCAQDLYLFLKGREGGKPPFAWLKPLPTFANFVLVEVSQVTAESLAIRLRKAGVLVRYFGVQGGALSNYIRISAGRPSDIKKLQDSLCIIDSEIQKLSQPSPSLSSCLQMLGERDLPTTKSTSTADAAPVATSSTPSLRLITGSDVLSNKFDLYRPAVTEETRASTNSIVQAVKREGEKELIRLSVQFGDLASPSTPYTYTKPQLKQAYESLPQDTQELLQRSAARVKSFAQAQRNSLDNCMSTIPGGNAGHTILPLSSAGCYAPGGRYPLPSSVLMTAIPAKLAGCSSVVVCSPSPSDVTLAAAHVAEADFFFAVGGAQAIAAMAYGAGPIPRCDVVVGPGNKWVTAAKSIVSGEGVAIDMLAGPSEVLVLADDTADAKLVAADLIAQAEHDEAAASVLVSTSSSLVKRVEEEIALQLAALSADVNRAVATASLSQNGMAILVESIEEGVKISDRLAPEHLEIHTVKPALVAAECSNYGAVFIGSNAAEVTGDYCAGPNHVLPTGGTARCMAGLSVFTFLRARTWMSIYDAEGALPLYQDAVALAKAEGLVGHGAAASARIRTKEEKKGEEATAVALPGAIEQLKEPIIKFAIPKGRMFDNVKGLLKEGGLSIKLANARVLRPKISLPGWDGKLLKPRDCVRMLDQGIRDIAFSGTDLLEELNASNVVPILDTGMDPIKLVAAAPAAMLKDGQIILPENRPLRIATEYVNSTRKWIEREKMFAVVVPTGGSTEVFPPEDADVIVDVSATGTTLRANQLIEYATVASSSTHLVASRSALENPVKRVEIEMFQCLLASVLDARSKVLMEFNVADEKDMERVLGSASLRGMCRPTVSPLDRGGFAVRVAVDRLKVPHLIFCVKENGGSDILVSNINNVVR